MYEEREIKNLEKLMGKTESFNLGVWMLLPSEPENIESIFARIMEEGRIISIIISYRRISSIEKENSCEIRGISFAGNKGYEFDYILKAMCSQRADGFVQRRYTINNERVGEIWYEQALKRISKLVSQAKSYNRCIANMGRVVDYKIEDAKKDGEVRYPNSTEGKIINLPRR